MSTSRPPVVIATDPKGDFSHDEIIAVRGPVNSILNTIQVGNFGQNFQQTWKAPNDYSLISRKMRIKGTINLVVPLTNGALGPATATLAPRQYPFHQLLTSVQTWVNNQSMGGQNFGEFAVQVMKYNADLIEKNTGSSATLPDFWTEYSNALSVQSGYTETNVLGDANQASKGRAGFGGFSCSSLYLGASTSGNVTVTINFDEPYVFGGPYSLLKDAPALVNVNTLQWAVNFTSNLNKAVSISVPNGMTVGTITPGANGLFTNVVILVESYDPSPFMKLPDRAFYPIDRYDYQPSQITTSIAAAALPWNPSTTPATQLVSPIISCPAVPARLYVFPKLTQGAQAATDSDFVAYITGVTVTFDSKPLLSTEDANNLALMSISNGFNGYFNDRDFVTCQANYNGVNNVTTTKGVVGPGLCLVFGKDIVLPDGYVSGSQGAHTIQVYASCVNQSASTKTISLATVLVYDEMLEVSQSTALVMPVNITPAESVKPGERIPAIEQSHGVAGGGLVYGRRTGFGGSHSGGSHSGGAKSGGRGHQHHMGKLLERLKR
jgi:hypothetical protein